MLWQGNTLLPQVVETLDMLRSKGTPPRRGRRARRADGRPGKQIVFVTNNSTKSRRTYITKLEKLGIPATVDEIFGSAYSAAVYISRVLKLAADKRVYVIGEAGIEEELAAEGVAFFGGTDERENAPMAAEDYDAFRPDASVGAVLVGLDHAINYRKLARAYQLLRHPDTVFLATNIDSTFPTHGALFPGAGTMSAPLALMTGRQPLSLGKPSQAMMDAIESRFKFDKSRTCMVGDRMNTDIRFGIEGGLGGTLGVLTGVSTEEEFLGEGGPDAYLDKLCDLLG